MPKLYFMRLHHSELIEAGHGLDEKSQRRLKAARLAIRGKFTAVQIAKQVGISRRRFFDWMKKFKRGGVEGLLKDKHHGGGPPPKMRGIALNKLRTGLKSKRWRTAKEMQKSLQKNHSICLKLSGVYYWLRKIGKSFKRDRSVCLVNNSHYWVGWWKKVQ
jgi:transposase